MKKTFIALALAASVAPAWAAEVVSSNIVGYSKLDLANGFTMVGVPFQQVGTENTASVQNIKASGLAGFDWVAFDGGDTLLIWDPSQQMYPTELVYSGDTQTAEMVDMGVPAGVWFDMATFAPADMELANGSAVWIVGSTATGTVTLSGEVPTNAAPVQLVAGFNMVANPYPKAAAINDVVSCSGLVGFDWVAFDGGGTLLIWDPAQQMYPTELVWSGDTQTAEMVDMGVPAGVWFDMATFAPADTEIPVGGAFWIVTANGGTLTFK